MFKRYGLAEQPKTVAGGEAMSIPQIGKYSCRYQFFFAKHGASSCALRTMLRGVLEKVPSPQFRQLGVYP